LPCSNDDVKIFAHLAALLLLCPVAAQAKPTPAQTKQALIEIERKIGQANLTCDYKYFAQIEAPEFIFTGSDGSLTTRAQDLAGESTCKPSNSTYDVDETTVWLNGTTAVVTGRVTITRQPPATIPITRSRFTDVFVYRDHHWQLVAGHSSRIRETPPIH
jgi:hypothetical protein